MGGKCKNRTLVLLYLIFLPFLIAFSILVYIWKSKMIKILFAIQNNTQSHKKFNLSVDEWAMFLKRCSSGNSVKIQIKSWCRNTVEGMPSILYSSLVPQQFPVTCGVQGWQEAKLWEQTHSFCLCSCHISPCLLLVFSCSLTRLVKAMETGSQTFQAPWRRNCLPDVHTWGHTSAHKCLESACTDRTL